ncbi:MAG: glycosyltransferase family 9 protein [Candidatus Neptunochlamydia sp.]|nr:glycosyltransferase family 9 protein [Candidatus Neptunochlamydia sp.]
MGDALMMMVASHRLKLEGYEVTTFQDTLGELCDWFPGHSFAKRSTIETLDSFDFILLQNDNTPFSFNLIDRHREKIHVFYASYEEEKHHPCTPNDYLFNRCYPMVANIAEEVASLLGKVDPIPENGITIPSGLSYRKHKKRVVIHPTSTTPKRTWTAEKFIQVAQDLEKKGFDPVFSVGPSEREEWLSLLNNRFPLPEFPTISELAAYLYESHFLFGNESGTGHLASNLGIPTLIIAGCPKQMILWRPGFLLGQVITPPSYIPNFKFLRLREKKWQTFISPRRILKVFDKIHS